MVFGLINNLSSKIVFLIAVIASIAMLNANYNQTFILKKKSSNSFEEYLINYNDLILIKCKNKMFPNQIFFGGKFAGIKNNYILFETNNKSLESLNLNDIEVIYTGNVRTWKDLRDKWNLYLSLLIIPGSIDMVNSPSATITDGVSPGFAAVITWSFFSMLSYVTYAPIIASIDFNKRKKNAIEFIIGPNHWEIN